MMHNYRCDQIAHIYVHRLKIPGILTSTVKQNTVVKQYYLGISAIFFNVSGLFSSCMFAIAQCVLLVLK